MDPPSVGLLIHGVSQQQKYLNIPCVCTEHVFMSLFNKCNSLYSIKIALGSQHLGGRESL